MWCLCQFQNLHQDPLLTEQHILHRRTVSRGVELRQPEHDKSRRYLKSAIQASLRVSYLTVTTGVECIPAPEFIKYVKIARNYTR